MHLTQPAMSKTLKELEIMLGVKLLERSRRGVALTVEGEVFLRHISTGLAAIDTATRSLDALQKGEKGSVSVGALPSVASRILPDAVKVFAQSAPDITPRIEDGPHGYLVERLRAGELDLVVGRLGKPDTMAGLTFTQLYVEQVAIVCAPGHPVEQAKSLAELADHQVIYPPENAAIRPLVDRMMIANGQAPFPNRIETVSAAFARGLAEAGEAVWVISAGVVAAELASGRLSVLPVETDLTLGPVGLMERADATLSLAATLFRQAVIRAVEPEVT